MIENSEWQKCNAPFFSRPTIDGEKTRWFIETWRRRTVSGWEYRQELEHYEDAIPPFWEDDGIFYNKR
ncbi:hypothetical protein [Rhizobiales bacterium]|jgi:hypothetical protein